MAHLQASRDPAMKNEPQDRLMQMLLLNQSVVAKQQPSLLPNNNPPEDPADNKSTSATV